MLCLLSSAELRHLEGKVVLAAKYLSLYEQRNKELPHLSPRYYRKCAQLLREVIADGRLALPPEALDASALSLVDDARMTWALIHERCQKFPVLDSLLQRLSRGRGSLFR